jgi:hypothetical protein
MHIAKLFLPASGHVRIAALLLAASSHAHNAGAYELLQLLHDHGVLQVLLRRLGILLEVLQHLIRQAQALNHSYASSPSI